MEKTEKISVSDLSIGDWVEIDGRPKRISSVLETPMGGLVRCQGQSITAFVEHISPIPLTPEILEKNGLHEAKFGLVVKPKSNELCASMGVSIEIQYIHELQHILRLTKTDKEIVL